MIRLVSRSALSVATLLVISAFTFAQNVATSNDRIAIEKPVFKPYKILCSGKRITIQSKNNINIKRILVWTSSGHRIVEQHELDVPTYTFIISMNEKIFFLMLETQDGKRYSEKFGVQ